MFHSVSTPVICLEKPADVEAREALLNRAFGASRFEKTCERLRENRLPAAHLSLVGALNGRLVATVRLWHVAWSNGHGLMLGPLAVDESCRSLGLGGLMMREALARAKALGHDSVILVGDEAYYQRFGFASNLTTRLDLPGAMDRSRFLGLELNAGALADAKGMVRGTGAMVLVRPNMKAFALAS
jgi:predicted N-acetyltransferase YhbS